MRIETNLVRSLPFGRHVCPVCQGGSSREASLTVFAGNGNDKQAYCHRAACGAWGRAAGRYAENAAPAPSPEVLRPYTGDRYALQLASKRRMEARFGFIPPVETVAYGTELGREPYIIPILAPNGQERGVVERTGWFGGSKTAGIWKAKDEPMISWTSAPRALEASQGHVLLVEDQISAWKWALTLNRRACALLGTNLTADAVAEIQRNASRVTLALDKDATGKAFALARRWGAAFQKCTVLVLEKDIKDMTTEEIQCLNTSPCL